MAQDDYRSVEQQVGMILGMIEPIPEQLDKLFDKVDNEKDVRSQEDAKIASDIRSIQENFQRLVERLSSIEQKTGKVNCEYHAEQMKGLIELTKTISDQMRDLKRIFTIKDGRSEWLAQTTRTIEEMEKKIEQLDTSKKSATAIAKWIIEKVLLIIIPVAIAWLMIRLGLR